MTFTITMKCYPHNKNGHTKNLMMYRLNKTNYIYYQVGIGLASISRVVKHLLGWVGGNLFFNMQRINALRSEK